MIKAGVAEVKITPPVGILLAGYGARERSSDAVDDDLWSKALVMDDSHTKVIEGEADQEWVSVLTRKMAGAVYMAHNNMKEAKIGAGNCL